MSITMEEAWKLMAKNGLKTKDDLKKELEKNAINIGIFIMPLKKKEDKKKES